jgi:hypothetical protein
MLTTIFLALADSFVVYKIPALHLESAGVAIGEHPTVDGHYFAF